MYNETAKAVAIITARGGSKRIPRKNIKDFLGFPIIKYSIDAALQAGCFDEVMVSTDDIEIADIARHYGAVVPFIRSQQSANDYAGTAEVIEEVLQEYKKTGREFDYCCCLYPTAPMISTLKLLEGYNLLKLSGADSVIPVVRFSYPIQRALKVENGKLRMLWPENLNARSQDLMPAFHDAGQFYWLRALNFLENNTLFPENSVALEIPESEVQDIDNDEDWRTAEIKFKINKELIT